MKPDPIKKNRLSALRIVAVYAVLGAAWVFLSDLLSQILARKYADAALDSVFIVVSSVTIYYRIVASFNRNRQMEEKLERNEERLKQALAASKMGVWEWDVTTSAVYWSPESFDIFGAESFSGTIESFTNLLHPDDAGYVMAAARKTLADNTPNNMQYRIIRSDGRVRWLSDHARPICNGKGTPQRLIGTVQDTTERKLEGDEVRHLYEIVAQEKDRLSALVNSISDEIWFSNLEGKFTLFNPAACSEFNLNSTTEIDVSILAGSLEVLRPDGSLRPIEEAPPLRALRGEAVRNQEELVRTPASGKLRCRQVNSSPVKNAAGDIIGTVSVVRDITESKRAEESLRRYAQHVIVLEEKMRRQLATELHDELGRDLTTIGLNFTIISNALSVEDREMLGERIKDSACIIEEMGRTVRNMMIRLRPPVLDDYGLVAALRSYADQISKRTGIVLDLQLEEIEPRLSEEIETTFFRIAQEALTNITKHAEAKCATLRLERADGKVQFSIIDDGRGFDSQQCRNSHPVDCWGLTIMRERAESVGARFSLDSNPGRGTVVSVVIGED